MANFKKLAAGLLIVAGGQAKDGADHIQHVHQSIASAHTASDDKSVGFLSKFVIPSKPVAADRDKSTRQYAGVHPGNQAARTAFTQNSEEKASVADQSITGLTAGVFGFVMFAALLGHRLRKWFQQPAISNVNVEQGLETTKASALLANTRTLELRSQDSTNMQERPSGWKQSPSTVSHPLTVAYHTATTTAPVELENPALEKFRKDYKQPNYWVREVQMDIKIYEGKTMVEACLSCELNTSVASLGAEMFLDGEDLQLESVAISFPDGREVTVSEGDGGYKLVPDGMIVTGMEEEPSFILKTLVSIEPEKNTQLSGLYFSGCMYCTQMEAQGFRRFTYMPDRPDVMARYTRVRIEADKKKCPVLLGNGNQIEEGDCADDAARHFAVWEDPFAKPSYLFAIVAGDLGSIHDSFTTASGREVKLAVFSEKENVGKLRHCMESLQRSMKWDEDRFGLEYDLDIYNIVAVNDFNMGAMENKGLNVFNTSLTLASPDTATDTDYERIEGVVGHEYFHNWTGNRVTCRDWFQLTLKEGLTVFRDQEFSSDMGSRAVNRVENVRMLRGGQFREDGGPMSHPIRPESYIAMDNFYTATVYSKGAEVIRMYQTLLGREGFRKGMDLYFERHDGSAVSCDDFRSAMADANSFDFSQFEEWYLQPGTPQVEAASHWDDSTGTYALTLKQIVGAGQRHLSKEKRREKPMHVPVVVGLLDRATGKEVVPSTVLELKDAEQTFSFSGLESEPVPSLLRNFSAPVKFEFPYSREDLAFLAAYDTDPFNRWEATQRLGAEAVLARYDADPESPCELSAGFTDAFRRNLTDTETTDLALLAYALTLPLESALMETMSPPVDPIRLHAAHGAVRKALATEFKESLQDRYASLSPAEGEELVIDSANAGKRQLRNVCLSYLATARDAGSTALCASQFAEARARGCMTDKLAALACLANVPDTPEAVDAMRQFFEDANGDALVLNKWFSMQAFADVEDILSRVKKLMDHPDFTFKNPNRLRSLISVFAGNVKGFHKQDGSGYEYIAEMVLKADEINPQVAARLIQVFATWPKLDVARQSLVKKQLDLLNGKEDVLSKDTYEVVGKLATAA
jgi:aminopeptidase N